MVSITILMCSVIILVTAECVTAGGNSDPFKTLRMVHVLFRHGDRAPLTLYPNDPNRNISSEVWPEGLGQLTKIGKVMAFDLGLWLRKRYDGFIKKVFDTEEIYVRSTDVDRTLMSAECVMAAFYRPDYEQKFREDLPWVPTPIHTSPAEDDKLLAINEACPRVASEFSKILNTSKFQDFYKQNEEFFEFIIEKSGINITSPLRILIAYDALHIERLYNLTIPSWAVKAYDQIKTVSLFYYKIFFYTRKIQRLRTGPLLRTIAETMRNKSLGDLPERKMIVFSGHDITLSTLLTSMGVYNGIIPPYSATVMIELHQVEKNYFVKMYYQNDTTLVNPLNELILPGCAFECPLSNWIYLLKDVIPEEWEKECQIIETLQNYSDPSPKENSTNEESTIQMAILHHTDSRSIDLYPSI